MRPVPVIFVFRLTNTALRSIHLFWSVQVLSLPQCLGYTHRLTPTSVILALFVTILAALVTRSVRRRRLRNAAFGAAFASGAYGPSGAQRGNQDGASASKPILWETLITSVYDEGTGWAGLSVRHFPNRSHSLIIIRMLRPYITVSP